MLSPVAACLQASLLITVLLLVRAFCLRHVQARVLVACWWLVLIRLLVPVFPLSQPVVVDASSVAASGLGVGALSGRLQDGVSRGTSSAFDVQEPVSELPDILWFIWACVAAVLGLAAMVSYIRCRLRLRNASALPASSPVWRIVRDNMRLHRTLRCVELDGLSTPVSYGVIHPTIVLPKGFDRRLTQAELRLVLIHEYAHVRRFDTLVKPLAVLLACAYWFNPLIWASVHALGIDMERASDEAALRGCSRKEIAMYARTLLKAKTSEGVPFTAFGASAVESRIRAILAPQPNRVRVLLACILVLACCLGAAGVAWAAVPVASQQSVVVVQNGPYSFEIPAYWQGKVSIRTQGLATYVYPTGYPDEALVSFQIVDEDDNNLDVSVVHPIVYQADVSDGRTLFVQASNYLDLAAGNLWSEAAAANPSYPGETGEKLAVDLSTGGAYNAEQAHNLDGTLDESDVHKDALDYVRDNVVPSIKVEQSER